MTDRDPRFSISELDAHGRAVSDVGVDAAGVVGGRFATRPVLAGTFGMVSAGHYLASAIGLSILERGGNAVDAAVAAGFALTVLKPQSNGIGGEVPIMVYLAAEDRTVLINGQGWAPAAATLESFRREGIADIPGDGFLPAVVPGAFAAWCTALLRYGTLTLADALGPAVDLAEGGFPAYDALINGIARSAPRFLAEWPTSANTFLVDGRPPREYELQRNPDWASTFKGVIDTSLRAGTAGRELGIRAAMEYFYAGPIARQAVRFATENSFLDQTGRPHRGLFTLDDWTDYLANGTTVEAPLRVMYRGVEVFKCPPWSQGPVFLQQLKLLEGLDLPALGHNSAAYLHAYLEAAKLAFADRERYYGDPEFVDVPVQRLLSDAYAAERRALIDPVRANPELRPGEPWPAAVPVAPAADGGRWGNFAGDTTHVDTADRWGNMVAATPSGGWLPSSPVIEGLGFPLGTRGQMFYLDERHPAAIAPRKRPRTTLSPSMARFPDGRRLAFGTPGGDQQDQWTLQFFLNVVDFGMDLQEALDAPTAQSAHFPGSFYPHTAYPNRCLLEDRIAPAVIEGLRERGHEVVVEAPWSHGQVTAVMHDPSTGVLMAAASPRGRVPYAMGR